jgi:hypothetical protein
VDRALEDLKAILVAEKCRRGRVRLEGLRLALPRKSAARGRPPRQRPKGRKRGPKGR